MKESTFVDVDSFATLASSECRRYPKPTRRCTERFILTLLFAYQEFLVTFKLMTSQAVQRSRPLTTRICPLGIKGLTGRTPVKDSWGVGGNRVSCYVRVKKTDQEYKIFASNIVFRGALRLKFKSLKT